VPDQRSDDKGPEITSARFADLLRVDRKFHSPDGDTWCNQTITVNKSN